MNQYKTLPLKLQFIYLLVALLLSIFGTFLELLVNFDSRYKVVGVVGDLFYLYLFVIETAFFGTSLYYYSKSSPKYYSFELAGAVLSVVGSILNILSILGHLLLSLPPISASPYQGSWSFWNEISLITMIGILSLPFLIKIRKNITL